MAYPVAVSPAGGQRTWTVLGENYATVGPIEEWIEAHRHLWSPNTVRGYATSLAQWWTFLEQREEVGGWRDVGVPAVTAFLSWQRNGRTLEHSLAESGEVPTAATLEVRLAALISFYRWHQAVSGGGGGGPAAAGDAASPTGAWTAVAFGCAFFAGGLVAGASSPRWRQGSAAAVAAAADSGHPRRLRGIRFRHRFLAGKSA